MIALLFLSLFITKDRLVKLIRCKNCEDVVRLIHTEWRQCECNQSGGQYNDDLVTATVGGNCEVVGLSNLFFDDKYRKMSEKEKTKHKKDINHGPCEVWWGELEGDNQIHRIKSAKGPKLEVEVEELEGNEFTVTFKDKRDYSINLKGDKKPDSVTIDQERKSSFKGKKSVDESVRKIVRKIIKESLMQETTQASFEAFHGSEQKISKFEDSFLSGEKVVQHYGAGIYFTTSLDNAKMFGENVYKVHIDGNFVDKETPADSVELDTVIALMKMSDDEWEMEAQNYHEDPETGIMISAQSSIDYADNEADVFLRVQSAWYPYEPLDYVRAMTKLGYDGMIVDAPRDFVGEKHIIIFNPEAVTLTGKER